MFKSDKREARISLSKTPGLRLPAGPLEAISDSYNEARRASNSNAITFGLKEEYRILLDDIEKRTGQRLINPANYFGAQDSMNDPLMKARLGTQAPQTSSYDAQVTKINEFIARNQKDFPDLKPVTHDEVLERVIQKGRAAREDWALTSQYTTGWGKVGGFVGGMGGAAVDPPNIIATVAGLALAAPSGGGSMAVVGFMGREAAINVGATVIAEPGKREVANTLGYDRTFGDFAEEATFGAVFGAGAAGGSVAVSKGFSALRNSASPSFRSKAIFTERGQEILGQDNPGYTSKVATAESGGNLTAKAATSSATGKFQFIQSTWNELADETGVPKVVRGQPDPRLDEAFQSAQMAAYTKRSDTALKAAGLATDDTNRYITHFLGQKGGVDFLNGLKASPDAPAASFADPDAVAANWSVFHRKDGTPKTATEFYRWAQKKMGGTSTGLPEQHLVNYDKTMQAMAIDGAVPDLAPVPGKARPPYIEGLETLDPDTLQVDARTFQFKEGGDDLGVTDRLSGVSKWEQDFAGVALVWERSDGSRFIADGHQRLGLAKRSKAAGQDVALNARVLKETDGWTPDAVRVRAAVKNISEGTGSPLDAARIMRAARDADLPPLPPTSSLVRQGRALSELADEPFMMVVNGVVPENYGALVGKLIRDPKLQEAAIKVLNKTNPDNITQAETVVRQVADTPMTTQTQSTLFGDEVISESLFLERAKVMDAAMKSLKKDKQVFSTLVNQAERIEGVGNKLSRETNLERMTEDAKVSDLIQKLSSRKGPVSDALNDAARKLKEGARPGDATRSFLQAVRGATDEGMGGSGGGRSGGSLADDQRTLEPAEIKAQQEFFEKQPEDYLDELISGQVDEAFADGRLSKDMELDIEVGGTMVKKKIGDVLDDLEADQRLVTELTDCVEGAVA